MARVAEPVLPGHDVEHVLLELVRSHLADEQITVDDDFYAMGGDSLVALRVVADANKRGIPIALRDVLYYPTVRELAAVPQQAGEDGRAGTRERRPFELIDPAERAALPAGVVDAVPAPALSVGLIYLCVRSGDPTLYHDLIGIDVQGRFDERLFRRALAELCARHPALRSSFDLVAAARPLQLVWADVTVPVTVQTVSTQDEPAADALVDGWRETQLSQPIPWDQAPAFLAHVVALPESFRLSLAFHHCVIDGWSLARAVVELLTLYDALLTGTAPQLPAVPEFGHQEFVALEQQALESSPEEEEFWLAQADAPPLLPDVPDATGAAVGAGGVADQSERILLRVDDDLLRRLRDSANRSGVPLKSLVLAAHLRSLALWAGRGSDIVTGVVVNGRPEILGGDLLVGLFLNTVPLRMDGVTGTWRDLATRVLQAEQQAFTHRRYPLVRIEQRLGRPAFDVAFNFTNFHAYEDVATLRAVRVRSWWTYDKNSLPVMVDFMVDSPHSGTGVSVAFDPRMVDRARARRLADLFRDSLDAAAGGPEGEV